MGGEGGLILISCLCCAVCVCVCGVTYLGISGIHRPNVLGGRGARVLKYAWVVLVRCSRSA